ncbi:MAG TPA: hypothetical protein VFN91_15605 [Myxococcaceae bacterium]|nr:hypothetical protein [Myxococcaceae bacterium]
MHLVASIRPAADLEAAVAALEASAAMTKAEARMRLAPEPPALLARLSPEDAAAVVTALGQAGLPALAVDEDVALDSERFQVRSFAFEPGAGRFTSRTGDVLAVPWDDIRLVLRGVRTSRTTTEHTETQRKLAPGRAVLTGGLMFTKKTTTTVRNVQEDSEQFLLLHSDAGPRLILAEQTLEFSGLGPVLQPARTANLGVLEQELRRRTPRAFHDDRLLRLGRRRLPFILGGNERRSDTRGVVDVLAEVLDQAVRTGLLP